MVSRFRTWEETAISSLARMHPQIIVAVTANGASLGKPREDNGFDEVCNKPMTATDIRRVVEQLLL